MKILWCGDAAVSTGFARCTHAACDALYAAGHEVHILGINYWGDPHPYPYPIYPPYQPLDQGRDGFGVTRLPVLKSRLNPDAIVLLNDPWNIPSYLESLARLDATVHPPCPVVAWLAVDAKNQHGTPLNALAHVVTWTQFAADELARGGYTGASTVVPLGVDSSFYPAPPSTVESHLSHLDLPPSAFIVGVVGRNQPRKRLDLTIAYFAEWVTTHDAPDAYLYLHIAPTGEMACDIRSLARYYGMKGRIILAETGAGTGVDDDAMRALYSSFSVYLSTTQGEGWGLPTLEAMACGTPVIAPDWSGLGSDGGWTNDAALLVPCTSTALSAPLNGNPYTLGGVIDRPGTIQALDLVYNDKGVRAHYRDRGLALARTLTWEKSGEQFVAVLEKVAQNGI